MPKYLDRIAGIGPYIVMLLGGAAIAVGFNLLLIPVKLLSSGVSGIAMILGYVSGWNIAWLYFALNVPILFWGYRILGKRFIVLSVVSVLSTALFLQMIPEYRWTDDPLLAAVFGGVLVGIGSAVSLRYGGSTGGLDIVASIISRYRDVAVGFLVVLLNTGIVAALGFLKSDWNSALYSMLSIYLTGKVIDLVHTPHRKITFFIVTNRSQELAARLLSMPRGVTILKTRGAFTSAERDLLMTVTTRFEMAELRKIIQGIDPKAFVNIVQTVEVIGEFRRLPP
jgi:uncharacterized membrane-anchored protein YitT (DUF2179 family)